MPRSRRQRKQKGFCVVTTTEERNGRTRGPGANLRAHFDAVIWHPHAHVRRLRDLVSFRFRCFGFVAGQVCLADVVLRQEAVRVRAWVDVLNAIEQAFYRVEVRLQFLLFALLHKMYQTMSRSSNTTSTLPAGRTSASSWSLQCGGHQRRSSRSRRAETRPAAWRPAFPRL